MYLASSTHFPHYNVVTPSQFWPLRADHHVSLSSEFVTPVFHLVLTITSDPSSLSRQCQPHNSYRWPVRIAVSLRGRGKDASERVSSTGLFQRASQSPRVFFFTVIAPRCPPRCQLLPGKGHVGLEHHRIIGIFRPRNSRNRRLTSCYFA